MKPIVQGQSGAAVEDIQERLIKLGYTIDVAERAAGKFGPTTQAAVDAFHNDAGLPAHHAVDEKSWSALVDATYNLGDRTLYLRLPNFHGHDVMTLQQALNTLGFHSGLIDGLFGAHTEAALKQFQENIGELADGMLFADTAHAILRLHHVWENKFAGEGLSLRPLGFARAIEVLNNASLALLGADPIARSIAARIWNLATATNPDASLVLLNRADEVSQDTKCVYELSCERLPARRGATTVAMSSGAEDLDIQIQLATSTCKTSPKYVRIYLPPEINDYSGSFTDNKAQILAGILLDALCSATAQRAAS